jgi:hypothetical protein
VRRRIFTIASALLLLLCVFTVVLYLTRPGVSYRFSGRSNGFDSVESAKNYLATRVVTFVRRSPEGWQAQFSDKNGILYMILTDDANEYIKVQVKVGQSPRGGFEAQWQGEVTAAKSDRAHEVSDHLESMLTAPNTQ